MTENIEIIIGTYEQFLLGYKIEKTNTGYKLSRSFATHSHQASVRDVSSNKHYLASAGADDSIYLYNMKSRIESGKLTHHNDTVNSVAFTPDSSHIFSCSSDGSIAAVRCGNWKLEKHWKSAHKGSPVNTLCIHPSGKLALSLGGDGVLRTWNLVKGRQAYATNLVPKFGLEAKNITITKWNSDGTKYLVATNFKVILYSVETAGIIEEALFELRVSCVEFINDNLIIVGHDDGQIQFYDFVNSEQILSKDAHKTRVKSVASNTEFIATASSSGEIKLWRFNEDSLSLLATENCGARITCMVLAENFPDLEMKKEEIVINDSNVVVRRKNVFKIRQEVVIEDEDNGEAIKLPEKALKKLKKKLKPGKTISRAKEQCSKKNKVTKLKPKELEKEENEEPNSSVDIQKLRNKKKVRKEKSEKLSLDKTIDLSSPTPKTKNSPRATKSVAKIIKRKGKKLKKLSK